MHKEQKPRYKAIIIKERVSKNYRIKELDEKIRKSRTKREINILEKSVKIINVPKILAKSEFSISMEYINGDKIADCLDECNDKDRIKICKLIGKEVALLHNNNIIHGDLTTSKMILKDNKVYFIDFGLGFIDHKIEHKAVDLHLLRQALESKHFKHYKSSFEAVIDSYKENSNNSEAIFKRLDIVEGRGRYKNKKKS